MRQNNQKKLCTAVGFLLTFVLWTILVRFVDVRAIGPNGSSVGFAAINGFFHKLTGVHMVLYHITDWLGLVPIGFVMGFGTLGLVQWIKRKDLKKVDYSILVLGIFYIVVMAVFLLFEVVVINYRPVLIQGCLEASYPSSTTMLVMCVMPTAIMQFHSRIKSPALKQGVTFIMTGFIAFMIIGRLLSGVHWLTDIVGGACLSAGLVMMYDWICGLERK